MKANWMKWCAAASMGALLLSCAPAEAPTPTLKATAPAESRPTVPPTATTLAMRPGEPSPTPRPASEEGKHGGTMLMSHQANPPSYDPIQETSTQAATLVIPSYSGVLQHDPLEHAKVVGDLAEKWDISQDGLTYTFHLYKNVRFHDGSSLTAEDARFSMETVRKPPKGVVSPRAQYLNAVDRIEAADKDTLKITLQYPSASFLDNLADGRMVLVPKHVFEAKGNMKRDVVGTGPYKFKSHIPGASWSVVKNLDYFINSRPYLDGITWYIIPDSGTRFAALRTHRVHITGFGTPGLTATQADLLRKEMSDQIVVQRYSGFSFHAFWMPNAKAPWSDIRVRRAVDLTLDRPKLIQVAMQGGAVASGFMPPGSWGLPEAELLGMPGYRQPKDADIAEAKRLMAEAGYAQGFKTIAMGRNWVQYERGLVGVKQQLAQIGIEVTISTKDQATMEDIINRRAFDTAYDSGSAGYDDPDQVLGPPFSTGGSRNYSGFSDKKIDEWHNEQSRTMDPAKRKQIVLDMQRRMHELVPASMLYWNMFDIAHWNELRNFKHGIGNYNNLKFQNVWLER